MSQRTAQHLASRLATLLIASDQFGTKWEIVAVHAVETGHQLVLLDPLEQIEYLVTVQKRSKAPALVATVEDKNADENKSTDKYFDPTF